MDIAVMKFGGGILQDRARFEHVASLVHQRADRRNVVVVSAVHGVTDHLIALLETARTSGFPAEGLAQLRARHDALVVGTAFQNEAEQFLDRAFSDLESLFSDASALSQTSSGLYARVVSYGERISGQLMRLFLNASGVPAVFLSSEEAGVFSADCAQNATCDLNRTHDGLSRSIPRNTCVVLPGFYGVGVDGSVHLFGRGGSDYSAGCIAACLDADVLEIWKDVPGLMSADPRVIGAARVIAEVSFAEARELGFFGSKIIHPRTFEPLTGHRTMVRIVDVDVPHSRGTRILEHVSRQRGPVSVSEKKGVVLFSLSGGGMAESAGVMGSVFSALKDAGVSVDLISTGVSEITFSLGVHQAGLARRVLEAVRSSDPSIFSELSEQTDLAHVALVGHGSMDSARLSLALDVFSREGIQPLALSCPRSGVSISFIVPQGQCDAGLRALHRAFFESTVMVSA